MKFVWRYLLVVAAVVAGSLLLAACGGEEELDLDEYFQRLEEINDEGDRRSERLQEESSERLQEELEGVGEEMEAVRDYHHGMEGIVRQILNDMKGLDPPAEARDAHDEYVAALAEVLAAAEDIGDRIADVESLSEFLDLYAELQDEPKSVAASERFDDACRELQGIADENDIDVDLRCD